MQNVAAPQETLTSFEFEERESLSSKELSEYLHYLRMLYGALLELFPEEENIDNIISNWEIYEIEISKICEEFSPDEIEAKFYERDLEENELLIAKIQKESPVTIVFLGVICIVTIAAVISGGELNAKGLGLEVSFKLPPIGEGLKKLKELFKRA